MSGIYNFNENEKKKPLTKSRSAEALDVDRIAAGIVEPGLGVEEQALGAEFLLADAVGALDVGVALRGHGEPAIWLGTQGAASSAPRLLMLLHEIALWLLDKAILLLVLLLGIVIVDLGLGEIGLLLSLGEAGLLLVDPAASLLELAVGLLLLEAAVEVAVQLALVQLALGVACLCRRGMIVILNVDFFFPRMLLIFNSITCASVNIWVYFHKTPICRYAKTYCSQRLNRAILPFV